MRKSKPEKPADARRPIAISLLRFSSPAQRQGDSLRRQTQGTEDWCKRHNLLLDLTLAGCGSAFRKTNDVLRRFLELVEEGRVPRGSYLIIENLDRMSRQQERAALRTWLDILDAGISIVQLFPETVFRHDKCDMVDIMRAVIELSRGHSESLAKSERSLANWEQAIEQAREGAVITRRLPGWVELVGGRLQLIEARALVVNRIFTMSASGYGASSIVKVLTKELVPAFGDRVAEEDGGTKQAEGQRYGCGEWRTSYVRSILKDRRALGEYQPRDRAGQAKGEVIANYYPPCVSEDTFYAARAAATGRRHKQGAIGKDVANLFGGLLHHARDGQTYYAATRSDAYGKCRVLLNKTSIEGRSRAYTFPYSTFEQAVLSCLHEIDPADIVGGAPRVEVSVLQGELNWLREQKAMLVLELMKGASPAIADAIRQREAREAELQQAVEKTKEVQAVSYTDTWADTRALVNLLAGASADELLDLRLRLRSAIHRIVKEAWLLVVPFGRKRCCVVQLYFENSDKRRDYLIINVPAHKGFQGRTEASYSVRSMAEVSPAPLVDLRDRAAVVKLEEELRLWLAQLQ